MPRSGSDVKLVGTSGVGAFLGTSMETNEMERTSGTVLRFNIAYRLMISMFARVSSALGIVSCTAEVEISTNEADTRTGYPEAFTPLIGTSVMKDQASERSTCFPEGILSS